MQLTILIQDKSYLNFGTLSEELFDVPQKKANTVYEQLPLEGVVLTQGN